MRSKEFRRKQHRLHTKDEEFNKFSYMYKEKPKNWHERKNLKKRIKLHKFCSEYDEAYEIARNIKNRQQKKITKELMNEVCNVIPMFG